MKSIVLSVLSIILCGGVGALAAWTLVLALGWTGVGGTIAMAILGMVIATIVFACGVALGRRLQILK